MLNYIKGDLFSVTGGVLAHACNIYGVWGGGIAAVFKRKFPQAYNQYHDYCRQAASEPQRLLGTCFVAHEGNYNIACLFTADTGCSVSDIVEYTARATQDMFRQVGPTTPINMPQINAGIFGVPWERTAEALMKFDPAQINVYVLP